MAIASFIAQLARMNPTGAIIAAVTFILLTVPALIGGILALERRFSGRTHTQRRDLIGLVRAIRGTSDHK
jgi:hypothetical protein